VTKTLPTAKSAVRKWRSGTVPVSLPTISSKRRAGNDEAHAASVRHSQAGRLSWRPLHSSSPPDRFSAALACFPSRLRMRSGADPGPKNAAPSRTFACRSVRSSSSFTNEAVPAWWPVLKIGPAGFETCGNLSIYTCGSCALRDEPAGAGKRPLLWTAPPMEGALLKSVRPPQ
jgi:hypothetical protein